MILFILLGMIVFPSAAQEYQETARIGRGKIGEVYWVGDQIAVTTVRGVWFYQAADLNLPPRLLELDYGELPEELEPRQLPFESLYFEPHVTFDAGGTRIALLKTTGGITIYDVETLTEILHFGDVEYEAVLFDGDQLYAAYRTDMTAHAVQVWNLSEGTLVDTLDIKLRTQPRRMALSADKRYLAVNGRDRGGDYEFGEFYLIDLQSRELVATIQDEEDLPDLPDLPPLIVSPSTDAFGFAPEADKPITLIEYPMAVLAFSPDMSVSIEFDSGNVNVIQNDETLATVVAGDFESLIKAAFSPDGERFALVDADSVLTIYGVYEASRNENSGCWYREEKCIMSTNLHMTGVVELETPPVVNLDESDVVAVSRSADGETIAVAFSTSVLGGCMDTYVEIRAAGTVTTLPHNDCLVALAFSADGQRFVSTTENGQVLVWDTTDWSVIDAIPHPNTVQSVTFNGDDLLTYSGDGLLRVWSAP